MNHFTNGCYSDSSIDLTKLHNVYVEQILSTFNILSIFSIHFLKQCKLIVRQVQNVFHHITAFFIVS